MITNTGFLNIYKQKNMTSHDVVAILRKKIGIKKIGHSGTLDPFATGVLVIGINDATRLFEYLKSDKIYIAQITFGIDTDTNDITGNLLQESSIIPDIHDIAEKLNHFKGKIKQVPPIYSAINVNGTRAYKLARNNKIDIGDLKEREAEIYSIEVISYSKPLLTVKIHCSGGTYIRAIARDLGKALNTCATLSSLERLQIGEHFFSTKSISLDLIDNVNWNQLLIKPQDVLPLEKINLSQSQIKDITYGKSIPIDEIATYKTNQHLLLIDNNNNLIAIGILTSDCIIKPVKVFPKSLQYEH